MHWSGLLTSTEVTEKIAAYGNQSVGILIDKYKAMIIGVQETNPAQRFIDTNEVVPTAVNRFFSVTLAAAGYTTIANNVGQPTGFTLLTKISW